MLLLLCLAIPLQAMATAGAPRCPCPMTAPSDTSVEVGVNAEGGVAVADADADDCCNDAETAARTGQPCKSGQECHAPVLALADAAVIEVDTFASAPTDPRAADRNPVGRPAVVWRPPAPALIA